MEILKYDNFFRDVLAALVLGLSGIALGQVQDVSALHFVPIAHNQYGVVGKGKVYGEYVSTNMPVRVKEPKQLAGSALTFERGRLTLVDGKSPSECRQILSAFPPASQTNMVGVLKRKWRKQSQTDQAYWDYWEKSDRIRLWFFNPNGAGTLFAEAAVLLFALALFVFKKRVWRSLTTLLGLICIPLLLMTGSRGSFLAALSGVALLLLGFLVQRKVKLAKFVVIFCAALAILLVCMFLAGGGRFTKNLITIDAGNLQRLRAWSAAPAMLVSAPWGWGVKPGCAYDNWFQPFDDRHPLVYLVNTHLTWMVQYGWLFSITYVFCWIWLIFHFASNLRRGQCAAVVAMLGLFFVANWFSTVGIWVSLWVIPVLMVVVVLGLNRGVLLKREAVIRTTFASLGLTMLVCGTLWEFGKMHLAKMPVPVSRDYAGIEYVGSGEPLVYVVPDDWVLCGFRYGSIGRDVRAWCLQHPHEGTLALVTHGVKSLPKSASRVVLVGLAGIEYLKDLTKKMKENGKAQLEGRPKELAFISTPFSGKAIPHSLFQGGHVRVWEGEFLAQETGDAMRKMPWVTIVPRADLYLPNWVDLAMAGGKQ